MRESSFLEEEFHPPLDHSDGDRSVFIEAPLGVEHPQDVLVSEGKPSLECCFDILGQISHAIDPSLAIVNTDGVMFEVEGLEMESSDFSYSQSTAQHQQKHCAVVWSGDVGEEPLDMSGCHRFREESWHHQSMLGGMDGIAGELSLIHQKGEVFGQQHKIVIDGSGRESFLLASCQIPINVSGGDLS